MTTPRHTNRLACSVMAAAAVAALHLGFATAGAAEPEAAPNRWEKTIQRFEQQDTRQSPPKNAVLFLGSSSIVGWNVKEWFPDVEAINRGFGGSEIADSVRFAERIVIPYEPRVIVFYAGDNDVAHGKTPEQVLADFRRFTAKVHAALPKTRIVFVAIKPSIRRWQLVDKMRKANRMIREVCQSDERLVFVDIDPPMIGPDGKPKKELFRDDGLHLNAAGYRLWSDLVRPHLK